MSWPGHVNDAGGVRHQFHHVNDIVPTILEAIGIPAPDTINGIKQDPIEGTSMKYTWDKKNANVPTRHRTQYFEMLGNRAIYHDGWMAATTPATLPWELSSETPPDILTGYKWELYNIMRTHPVERPGCKDAGEGKAAAGHLHSRGEEVQRAAARQHDAPALESPRPNLTAGRTIFTYSGELTGVPRQRAPEHPEQDPTPSLPRFDIPRRRGRHDRHRGRALRRLWTVPDEEPLVARKPDIRDSGRCDAVAGLVRARAGKRRGWSAETMDRQWDADASGALGGVRW